MRHSDFVRELTESEWARRRVADWLRAGGHRVRAPSFRVAPRRSDWRDYVDDGDLWVQIDGIRRWWRVEVKRRPGIDFTGPDDFPYPTLIVDEVRKVDRLPIANLFGYVITNASATRAAIVFGSTKPSWGVTTVEGRTSERPTRFYVVDPRSATWVVMETTYA